MYGKYRVVVEVVLTVCGPGSNHQMQEIYVSITCSLCEIVSTRIYI